MQSNEIKVGQQYLTTSYRKEIVLVTAKKPKGVLTVEKHRRAGEKSYKNGSWFIHPEGEAYLSTMMSRELKCPVDEHGNPLPCKSLDRRRKQAARTELTKVQREEALREASKYLGILGIDSTTKYAQFRNSGKKKLLLMLDGTGSEELLEILKELAEAKVKSLVEEE